MTLGSVASKAYGILTGAPTNMPAAPVVPSFPEQSTAQQATQQYAPMTPLTPAAPVTLPSPEPSGGGGVLPTLGGAAIGAGIGSAIFPGAGTLAGGLLGGWVSNHFFGGDDKPSTPGPKVIDPASIGDIQTQSRNYMKMLGISATDQNKILAQVQFQAESLGASVDQLPALVNQLLPQYASAAATINQTADAQKRHDSQSISRRAQIQAYLMPQLNGYMQSAQKRADDYGASTGNSSYGMMTAQANAAYASQLASLTSSAQNTAIQNEPLTPTLDDYLKLSLARQAQPIQTTTTG